MQGGRAADCGRVIGRAAHLRPGVALEQHPAVAAAPGEPHVPRLQKKHTAVLITQLLTTRSSLTPVIPSPTCCCMFSCSASTCCARSATFPGGTQGSDEGPLTLVEWAPRGGESGHCGCKALVGMDKDGDCSCCCCCCCCMEASSFMEGRGMGMNWLPGALWLLLA
eukprot:1139927-Pelagomonas_calceolata.AAC.6